jgi:hypothetical protein
MNTPSAIWRLISPSAMCSRTSHLDAIVLAAALRRPQGVTERVLSTSLPSHQR